MMNANSIGAYPEYHFRRVISGDIESVRRRLCDVLEDFNYVVLNENPIQAKRPPQKGIMTATVLEYDTKLTVALKPISAASTLATFDYAVQYLFTKGERQALEREADAMIALASMPLNNMLCATCGTENTGAVRFCRACGTPTARHKLPAELEAMRLTGGASAAQIEIVSGLIVHLVTLIFTLPMIIAGIVSGKPAVTNVGCAIFVAGQLLGLFFSLYGVRRLHKTLNPVSSAQPEDLPRSLPAPDRASLPPSFSVTEGTTELMNPPQRVPVSIGERRNTDPIE